MAILTMLVQRKLDKRHFKGASAPPAPDPYATADAQGKANEQAARTSTTLSRYDQVSPYGTTRWTQDPANQDKWTSTFTLDPQVQAMLGQYQSAAQTPLQSVSADSLPSVASGDVYRERARSNFTSDNNGLTGAMALRDGAFGNAQTANSNIGDLLRNRLNYDDAPAMPTADESTRRAVEDAYYQRQTSRLDPQYKEAEEALRVRLANEGLTPGSEAYNRELDQFGRTRNDAYSTARNDATTNSTTELGKLFSMGMSARQQGVTEANTLHQQTLADALAAQGVYSSYNADVNQGLATQMAQQQAISNIAAQNSGTDSALRGNKLNESLTLNQQQVQQRSQLLNELMALTTGSQVQGGGAGQVDVAAAPIAQSIYNTYQGQVANAQAQNQYKAALWAGLGQAAAAGASAYAASDVRTKESIVRIGEHSPGIGIYSFKYRPEFADEWGHGPKLGVLAQEVELVKPHAVAMHPDGYKMVDYNALEA